MAQSQTQTVGLYDHEADALLGSEQFADRVSLLPGERGAIEPGRRVRIMWGQDMLLDALDGKYRTIVCGINEEDNTHGIIAQLVNRITTSQWSVNSVTSYAKMFHESVAVHAAHDREPYVLKYDLDSVLILALLRPKGKPTFSLDDLGRGFRTIAKMLQGRPDRKPVAAVSFLGARSNRLTDADGNEPSFESVLRTIYDAGYRGDIYPSPGMWGFSHVGVFPSYPFPEGLARMREGSS
ncbi:MAG: hypothetical protein HND58_03280 [Planctomycetota bacterium]|nr:MAG: hypothetical protein HND58_03280 [Planctomycetota bacterium]